MEELFLRGLKDGFRREQRRRREMERKKEEEEARITKMVKMELLIENQSRRIGELQNKLEVEGARLVSDLEEVKSEFNRRMEIERNLWEEKMENMRNNEEAEEKKKVDAVEKMRADVESLDAKVKRMEEAEVMRKANDEAVEERLKWCEGELDSDVQTNRKLVDRLKARVVVLERKQETVERGEEGVT